MDERFTKTAGTAVASTQLRRWQAADARMRRQVCVAGDRCAGPPHTPDCLAGVLSGVLGLLAQILLRGKPGVCGCDQGMAARRWGRGDGGGGRRALASCWLDAPNAGSRINLCGRGSSPQTPGRGPHGKPSCGRAWPTQQAQGGQRAWRRISETWLGVLVECLVVEGGKSVGTECEKAGAKSCRLAGSCAELAWKL